MTGPDVDRRTLLVAIAGTALPAVGGCLGNGVSEGDFEKVDQDIHYDAASECANTRVRIEHAGDGDVNGEVEFDVRLLDGGGDPVSAWQRSVGDFSASAPADRAWIGGSWCQDEDSPGNLEDASDAEWRLRE